MPGLNRKGPNGAGPMTGGRRGLCGNEDSGYGRYNTGGAGLGRGNSYGRFARGGLGMGQGMGRGLRRGYRWNAEEYQEDNAADLETLKTQTDFLKRAIDEIKRRISDMEKFFV